MLFGAVTDAGPWRAAGFIGNLLGLNATATPPLLLVRPDDGLLLTLSLVNLDVRTGGRQPPPKPRLLTPYRLVVTEQEQHSGGGKLVHSDVIRL